MDRKKIASKKKRALTLIEMIVVLMIITMITGALAYNYKDSLNRGKEFERKEMLTRAHTIIELALAEGKITSQTEADKWGDIIKTSPLVKDGGKTYKNLLDLQFTVTYIGATADTPAQVEITPAPG